MYDKILKNDTKSSRLPNSILIDVPTFDNIARENDCNSIFDNTNPFTEKNNVAKITKIIFQKIWMF